MRACHQHPVQLTKKEQERLLSDFKKAMHKAEGEADGSKRLIAYLRFSSWQRELANAIDGKKSRSLDYAITAWQAIEIEVERLMK